MKTILMFCAMFVIVLSGVCCAGDQSQFSWDNFFIKMDGAAYNRLESAISDEAQQCSWGNPNNESVIPAEKRAQLYRAVAEGNEFAYMAGVLIMRCLDGGELEDFHRSTGIFFEMKPVVFLRVVEDRSISSEYLKYMLTVLPMDTVDNIDLAVSVVEKRIVLMKSINEVSLEGYKKMGLSFLEKELAMLVGVQQRLKEKSAEKPKPDR